MELGIPKVWCPKEDWKPGRGQIRKEAGNILTGTSLGHDGSIWEGRNEVSDGHKRHVTFAVKKDGSFGVGDSTPKTSKEYSSVV